MKVKVNRQLTAGKYHVNFSITDFSSEEREKMSSFGVPMIDVRWNAGNTQNSGSVLLTQIDPSFNAVFAIEQAAKAYEARVLEQIREKMQVLREREDDFTSSDEVEL